MPHLSDTVKVSLAFAVSVLVLMVAAGRWQGSVDTTISTLYEKAVANKEGIDKLHTQLDALEDRLNAHLESPNKDCNCKQENPYAR